MSTHMSTRTQNSARQHESGLFAGIILRAEQTATSIEFDMLYRMRSRSHLVPNFLLIGDNTGNTYHKLVVFRPQTEAGGEGISALTRARSVLLSRINNFRALSKEWSEDAIVIDEKTINLAARLVRELPNKWPFPQATLSSEGEIAFTWFNGKNRLEALLQPDHHLVWVVKNDGEYAPGRDIDLNAVASFASLFEAVALFCK